jgi:NAD(P)-dependent dehydrogenase (short-subunit alcohol dehydrogenase family)
MRLKDKVAIVTGAGRGIGLAIACALAREGARVAVCDIRAELLDKALTEIEAANGQALGFQMDVTNREQIQQVADGVLSRWGTIDILVNNAGIYEVLPFEEISEGQWDRLLAVNLKGAFLFCQVVVPSMKRQGAGRIVNIASSAGKTGAMLAGAHYSVSKAGLICLAKQLARELGPDGITVNAVAPGRIDTPMIHAVSDEENQAFAEKTPLGRLGTAEDVANAVVFLASDEASFITGEIMDVNGGLLID